jgi:hypothetical protein
MVALMALGALRGPWFCILIGFNTRGQHCVHSQLFFSEFRPRMTRHILPLKRFHKMTLSPSICLRLFPLVKTFWPVAPMTSLFTPFHHTPRMSSSNLRRWFSLLSKRSRNAFLSLLQKPSLQSSRSVKLDGFSQFHVSLHSR